MDTGTSEGPFFGYNEEESEQILSLDMSKVEVPPAGNYILSVISAKPTRAKTSGHLMLNVTYEVQVPDEYAGVIVYDRLMFEGPGIARTKAALDALELPYTNLHPGMLVGRRCTVHLETEEDPQYGRRARVTRYYPSSLSPF